MNNIKNWYNLSIDVSTAINNKQKIFDLADNEFLKTLNGAMWTFDQTNIMEYFNIEWVEDMKSKGLEIDVVFAFCRKPGCWSPPHIDCLDHTKDIHSIAINWMLNDNTESYQAWYSVTEGVKEPPMHTTAHYKGHYLIDYADTSVLTEIDRCYIGNIPVMVRTDIPHGIIHSDLRWSISVRFKVPNYTPLDGKNLTWKEQVDIMQPFIVDFSN